MSKQLSREDYIAIIGFFGNTAIINKKLRARAKKASFEKLLSQNMLRESICDAIYTNDNEKKKKICQHYHINKSKEEHRRSDNEQTVNNELLFKALVREFGVLEEILQLDLHKKYI